MAVSLAEYQKKQALFQQLRDELDEIEADPEFAQHLKFVEEIDAVLEKYGKHRRELGALIPPSMRPANQDNAKRDGRSGPRSVTLRVWKNPHTGETVEAKNKLNKTVRAWIEEHGQEEVDSWIIDKRKVEPENPAIPR